MKILMLHSGGRKGDSVRHAYRIHAGFMEKLAKHVTFHIYGPGEHERIPELAPIKYDQGHNFRMIEKWFTPDVVICYARTTVARWLPGYFSSCLAKRVILEVDYFNEFKASRWYMAHKFHYMIQRGFYRHSVLPPERTVWLPFSAHEDFLKGSTTAKDRSRIVFVGTWKTRGYYRHRRAAIGTLRGENLLQLIGRVPPDEYLKLLQKHKYIFADSCGKWHSPPAKHFEIMAAGNILLSSWVNHEKELFGSQECFVKYKYDLTDIARKAREIIRGRHEEKGRIANQVIKSRHLDRHRIQELLNILDAIHKGLPLPKRWGN